MNGAILAHGTDVVNVSPDSYLGSPMYAVADIHAPAVLAVTAITMWFLLRRRQITRGTRVPTPRWTRYLGLGAVDRLAVWAVGLSGAAHVALVPTHVDSVYGALFAVAGVLQLALARRFLDGAGWSRWTRRLLVASLLGYALSSASGQAPDQVGVLVKLTELGALAALTPDAGWLGRRRHEAAVIALAVVVATGAWVGAFASGEGGHHLGETPPPGVLLPPGEDRPPTAAEAARAAALHADVTAALAAYADPAVAAAAGYRTQGLAGDDFHAENPALKGDGHILEPDAPETLVYAVAASGSPVLLGAMFQMDAIGQVGPAVAGPLLVWHAHDHVCLSPVPPFLSGLTGPYGTCPLGSVTLPITNEMVHIWTVPGAPDPFGDLDDAWLAEYLARH